MKKNIFILFVVLMVSINIIGCAGKRESYEDVINDYCLALQKNNEEDYKELIYPSKIKDYESVEVVSFADNILNTNKEKWGDNPKLSYDIVNFYDNNSSEVKRYLDSTSTKKVFAENDIEYDDIAIVECRLSCNDKSANARFVMLEKSGEWYIMRLVPFE